jgi:hypothetical protein
MAQTDFKPFRKKGISPIKAALLGSAAAWLLLALPLAAQEAGLRRTFDTNELSNSAPQDQSTRNKRKKKKTRQPLPVAAIPLPEYRPVSSNGLPDEAAQDDGAQPAANSFDDPVSGLNSAKQKGASLSADATDNSARTQNTDADNSLFTSEIPVPGQRLPAQGDEEPDAPQRTRRDNLRETAVESGKRKPEDDPYAAPGIQAGAFTIRPTLETGIRWTSNSDSSANGTSALLSESSLRLRADSNWSRHRLGIEATGSWKKSVSGAATDDPEGGLAADFQADFSERTALAGTLGWNHSIEAASAPAAVTGALSRPTLNSLTGSLGLSRDLGRLRLSAKANASRVMYGDATDPAGVVVSQRDRNNIYAGLTLRAGYEISPALRPFIEGEAGRRIYDNQTDSFGLNRASTRIAVRAGVETDFGEKLRGDIAVGYLREDIADPALEDIAGLSLAGNLNWSPMRGTNVALTATTNVEGSSTATSSGSLLHALSLAVTKKARSNLDLNANLGASVRDYSGPNPNEITLSAGIGFTYWFSRYIGLNGRAAHESVISNDTARESKTNSVYVGVTLRR